MRLRWLVAALLSMTLVAGCAPDGDAAPGAGSPSVHPSGHEVPATDSAPGGGRTDY